MCESRAAASGNVFQQQVDAQVQLSRSLKAGHRDKCTACLSAEDSTTHCSTNSRRQEQGDDDDVCKLPDSVVVNHQRSDIIERLTEDKRKKHKQALEHLGTELTHLTQVCEIQVRTINLELLSSLQGVDLRLNTLKDRMDLDVDSEQEGCVLWEEVQEQVNLKKIRILELNHKLSESENQRIDKLRVVLRKYLHLLENINYLPSPDVCRLIHTEATMMNQSLLANRRSAALLLLLLQEENLQLEALLRLHLQDRQSRWRSSQVTGVLDRFRSLCSSGEQQQLVSGQLVQEKELLTELRDDIIAQICSLVPPTCSTALASDWYNQLTAVNQRIDSLHGVILQQQRCHHDIIWSDRLLQVKLCEVELSSLQLSEQQVNDVIGSQLLSVIERSRSQEEERLSALDRGCASEASRALALSRCVFSVMRGAALLWETHIQALERRRDQVQHHLDELTHSQQRHTQSQKQQLDRLLSVLRQQSSEEALEAGRQQTTAALQEVRTSCRRGVSEQQEAAARLPPLLLKELLCYSSSLRSFYHCSSLHPEKLQNQHLFPSQPGQPASEHSEAAEEQKPEKKMEENESDSAQTSHDWLTEAESCLLDLSDISSDVMFTSSGGVAYIGPAFRCPSPDQLDDLQQETHLSLFPVDLLTHTLSRMRTLFFDHLEEHFHDILSSAVAMVTNRKEAVRSEQELHLKELDPQHLQTHIYLPRLAELQLHRQQLLSLCVDVSEALTSCRLELKELQTSSSSRQQQLYLKMNNMEDQLLTAHSSRRLQAVSSTLQDCLDQHIKHTQHCQTTFRQTVHNRLKQARHRTTQLLTSFRLFSEGGDFAPQELKVFQKRLKEETKQIGLTEDSIYAELELFESKSLKQLKEASGRQEEKLSFLKSEVEFMEKTKKICSSTQFHIKAEAASSKRQQIVISSMLEDLRRMLENTQVSPDQVCSFLSSVNEELKKRCQYLDLSLDATWQESLSLLPPSRKQVRSAPPAGLLQKSRTGVDLLEDPVVGVIQSLNRLCVSQEGGASEREAGGPAAGQSPVQQKCTESVSTLSKSIRTERKFQVFGPEPEENPHSFSSTLNSVLWRSNDVLLLVAEDFYRSDRCGLSTSLLVPDSLDQWAESMQQRLLGYQEQIRKFLNTSREELHTQLSLLGTVLLSLPEALISNHEQRQGAGLMEEVGRVQVKQEVMLAASEKDKVNVRALRVSLRDEDLQAVSGREELRQQQLHSAVCCLHLELQVSLRVWGEEFVTSLASLTEQLLAQLDQLLTPAETEGPVGTHCSVSRTWSGIPYLHPPTDSNDDPPSSVTMATTASLTTTRCTLGHQAVIEQRDAAVKRFEQLFRSESLRSDDNKRRRLSELKSWNTHWRQQIHTLTHTLTHTH
ncbi:coiled-coil domain-containing protein 180 isoform X2 [Clinocottus analis]|uniref:coiled-coil domain-containing protein 180 isoform X2 n=1 Tax=Clinocottus analis TaxID=304258 RepID=UPI0035C08484